MYDISKVIKQAEQRAKTKGVLKHIIRNNIAKLIDLELPEDDKERTGFVKGEKNGRS